MKVPYANFGLTKLVEQGCSASIEGKIAIYDNLKTEVDVNGKSSARFQHVPIKIADSTILMFCLQGVIDFQLSFKDYTLRQNDVLMVHSGQLGMFYRMSGDVKFFIIFVHNNFLTPQKTFDSSVKLHDLLFSGPCYHCSADEMTECLQVYQAILAKMQGPYLYKEDVVKGYVYAMLYSLYSISCLEDRQHASQGLDKQPGTKRQMEIYNKFIDEEQRHYVEEHKIGFYAEKICVTPKYLSQVVYKVSGRFAKDYINDCLILEAKSLIKAGMTIQNVCYRLHFNSPTFFSRFFKQHTGFAPYEYQCGTVR